MAVKAITKRWRRIRPSSYGTISGVWPAPWPTARPIFRNLSLAPQARRDKMKLQAGCGARPTPLAALWSEPLIDHECLRTRGAGTAGETYCVFALQKPPFPLKAAKHC